jgi:hypothetical protein
VGRWGQGYRVGAMPNENAPTPPPDYSDEYTLLSIEPPTASRPTVLLTAAADGLRCVVELTLSAAGNLAASLRTVTVRPPLPT